MPIPLHSRHQDEESAYTYQALGDSFVEPVPTENNGYKDDKGLDI